MRYFLSSTAGGGLNMVLAYIFALLCLYLLALLLLGKNRLALRRLLGRAALVTALIFAVNFLGVLTGFRMPLNLVTILVPVFLGVPGFVMVALLQYLIF